MGRTGLVLIAFLMAGCSQTVWGPGPVVSTAPVQEPTKRLGWSAGGFSFQPQAEFQIRARVLSIKWYPARDPTSGFAPVDFALGWGPMSDDQVLDRLEISQSGRWYRYTWGPEGPPVSVVSIVGTSANMHLSPASPEVRDVLKNVREGDVVVLQGVLVDVKAPTGRWWKTSRSRTDTGAGACEIVWVDRAQREPAPRR